MTNPDNPKQQLRQRMQARMLDAQHDPQAPLRVRDLFLKHFAKLDPPLVVAATMPIRNEMDAGPLREALAASGHPICLPVMVEKGQPLNFRLYRPGEALVQMAWGIQEPHPNAPLATPEILLCPLMAFDRRCHRLGYGGGFYDVTIQSLRANGKLLAVGLAYAMQEVEKVPASAHDQRLDAVVTEKEVILP
ncbi:MAG TPA: 5-formyltetrahydrofolate cyclo-ligase [Alphaproteobacteria bacterium]|nr:5-formyltetrahydrofolate cyclo-ligase [Alphaproteobacteria bacterium]